MLIFDVNLNLFLLAGIITAAFALGYVVGIKKVRDQKRRIIDLEKEMLSNHAQILDLEKQKGTLLRELKERDLTLNRKT